MKRLIETIVLALLLIDPGGPSRHPTFAQDRDTVAEGDGVLDPKHDLFLFEEETKVISYTMSEERASQFALAINSTTPGHWHGEKDLESILRIPQTAVQA